MTNMRGGQNDVTVTDILDKRTLQPTLDVRLSGVTQVKS